MKQVHLLLVFAACCLVPVVLARSSCTIAPRLKQQEEQCHSLDVAGSTTSTGKVCVEVRDNGVAHVSIKAHDNWALIRNQLWVGQGGLEDVPRKKSGAPDTKKFKHYSCDFHGQRSAEFQIPLKLNCDNGQATKISVVAHSRVTQLDEQRQLLEGTEVDAFAGVQQVKVQGHSDAEGLFYAWFDFNAVCSCPEECATVTAKDLPSSSFDLAVVDNLAVGVVFNRDTAHLGTTDVSIEKGIMTVSYSLDDKASLDAGIFATGVWYGNTIDSLPTLDDGSGMPDIEMFTETDLDIDGVRQWVIELPVQDLVCTNDYGKFDMTIVTYALIGDVPATPDGTYIAGTERHAFGGVTNSKLRGGRLRNYVTTNVDCGCLDLDPTVAPTPAPSFSANPSVRPSVAPTVSPTVSPSANPSVRPSATPSDSPTTSPSASPTSSPRPSGRPSASPSDTQEPSAAPSSRPTGSPSDSPIASQTASPSASPSTSPSGTPSASPSAAPTVGEGGDKVQVFILMGQSNCIGYGTVNGEDTQGTLESLLKQDPERYGHLQNEQDGTWKQSDNVRYVHVMWKGGGMSLQRNEWLKVKPSSRFGPELGFGFLLGPHLKNKKILILKACIGNRSLGWDLLPPGSPQYQFGDKTYAGYGESPLKWTTGEDPDPISWYAGKQFDDDTRNVRTVLNNLETYYPGASSYEIKGFLWWQGHKDQFENAHSSKYEENLVRLVRSLRQAFAVSEDTPVVTATVGFNGHAMQGNILAIAQAQLAVSGDAGNYPEFAGNVKTVDSRPFWRHWSESPANSHHHYNHNAETYYEVGNLMGQAMLDLTEP